MMWDVIIILSWCIIASGQSCSIIWTTPDYGAEIYSYTVLLYFNHLLRLFSIVQISPFASTRRAINFYSPHIALAVRKNINIRTTTAISKYDKQRECCRSYHISGDRFIDIKSSDSLTIWTRRAFIAEINIGSRCRARFSKFEQMLVDSFRKGARWW